MKIIEASAVITARAGDMSGLDKVAAQIMKVSKAGQAAKMQFGGAAAEMGTRVQQIGSALSKIDNFRTLSRGLDQASIAMKQAQQTASRLKTALEATASPTAKMRAEYARASNAVERAAAAFKEQGQAVRASRSALEMAGIPVNQIARQQSQLRQSLDATTAAMQRQAQANRVLIGASRRSGRTAADVPHNGYVIRPGSKVIDVGGGHGGHGAGLAIGVHSMARVAAHGVHAANDLSNAVNQARMSGMTPDQVEEATTKAADLSSRYPTIPQAEIIRMIQSQTAVTGSFHHGMDAIEDNVRLRAVAQMKNPNADLGHEFEYLNKGMEIFNRTQSPTIHHAAMQSIAKATNFFGNTISLEDWYQMAIKSKGAASRMSTDFMFGVLPTMASEMRGSAAGEAIYSFNRAIVGGKMTHSAIKTLADMDMVDQSKVDRTKTGSIKGFRPGAVHGWQVAQSDPDRWVKDYLIPAFQKKGITDPDKADAILTTMFSSGRAAQFVKLLWNQSARIEKDRAGIDRAEGLEAAERNQKRDTGTAIKGVTTAFDNLTATLTGPVLEKGVPAINAVSSALNRLSNWGQENPGQAGAVGLATLAGGTYAATKGASWFLGQIGAQLGLGSGAAAGETAAGAAAGSTATGGIIGALASGAARIVSSPLGLILTSQALLEAGKPTSKEAFPYRFDTWSPDALAIYERSRRAQIELKQGTDMEGARGRALMDVSRRSQLELVRPAETNVSVTGSVEVTSPPIRVEASSDLIKIVNEAKRVTATVPLSGAGSGPGSTGRSMPEAAAPSTGSSSP